MNPSPNLPWLQDTEGRQFSIQTSCSIGRSETNQIALPDARVSRRHAVIQTQTDGEYWVLDFGSRNGTYLNGRRISQPTRLHHLDSVRVASFEWTFHHPDGVPDPEGATSLGSQTIVEINTTLCWFLVADLVSSTQLVQAMPDDALPLVTGPWLARCRRTIEAGGGRINQFFGDGFFALWRDRPEIESAVTQALQDLRQFQQESSPPFRLVLHHGSAAIGGAALGEEERVSGAAVHFVFRMEKLASHLSCLRLLSQTACVRLGSPSFARDAGLHPLPGFEGDFRFFEF